MIIKQLGETNSSDCASYLLGNTSYSSYWEATYFKTGV